LDPPYGIEYKSNFQILITSRDVNEGNDEDLTREPIEKHGRSSDQRTAVDREGGAGSVAGSGRHQVRSGPFWRGALAIVKPETVIAWQRAGFRLFWTWKVRRGQPGRPIISGKVRSLIRNMCRENPYWGAPHIHGELLKLGIDIGESSVRKYMVHGRRCLRPGAVVRINYVRRVESATFRAAETCASGPSNSVTIFADHTR
jgi:hypothetical protein